MNQLDVPPLDPQVSADPNECVARALPPRSLLPALRRFTRHAWWLHGYVIAALVWSPIPSGVLQAADTYLGPVTVLELELSSNTNLDTLTSGQSIEVNVAAKYRRWEVWQSESTGEPYNVDLPDMAASGINLQLAASADSSVQTPNLQTDPNGSASTWLNVGNDPFEIVVTSMDPISGLPNATTTRAVSPMAPETWTVSEPQSILRVYLDYGEASPDNQPFGSLFPVTVVVEKESWDVELSDRGNTRINNEQTSRLHNALIVWQVDSGDGQVQAYTPYTGSEGTADSVLLSGALPSTYRVLVTDPETAGTAEATIQLYPPDEPPPDTHYHTEYWYHVTVDGGGEDLLPGAEVPYGGYLYLTSTDYVQVGDSEPEPSTSSTDVVRNATVVAKFMGPNGVEIAEEVLVTDNDGRFQSTRTIGNASETIQIHYAESDPTELGTIICSLVAEEWAIVEGSESQEKSLSLSSSRYTGIEEESTRVQALLKIVNWWQEVSSLTGATRWKNSTSIETIPPGEVVIWAHTGVGSISQDPDVLSELDYTFAQGSAVVSATYSPSSGEVSEELTGQLSLVGQQSPWIYDPTVYSSNELLIESIEGDGATWNRVVRGTFRRKSWKIRKLRANPSVTEAYSDSSSPIDGMVTIQVRLPNTTYDAPVTVWTDSEGAFVYDYAAIYSGMHQITASATFSGADSSTSAGFNTALQHAAYYVRTDKELVLSMRERYPGEKASLVLSARTKDVEVWRENGVDYTVPTEAYSPAIGALVTYSLAPNTGIFRSGNNPTTTVVEPTGEAICDNATHDAVSITAHVEWAGRFKSIVHNTVSTSGLYDEDSDSVLNSAELTLGTNPWRADTDGDGELDAVEVANGTNPTVATSNSHKLLSGSQSGVSPQLPSRLGFVDGVNQISPSLPMRLLTTSGSPGGDTEYSTSPTSGAESINVVAVALSGVDMSYSSSFSESNGSYGPIGYWRHRSHLRSSMPHTRDINLGPGKVMDWSLRYPHIQVDNYYDDVWAYTESQMINGFRPGVSADFDFAGQLNNALFSPHPLLYSKVLSKRRLINGTDWRDGDEVARWNSMVHRSDVSGYPDAPIPAWVDAFHKYYECQIALECAGNSEAVASLPYSAKVELEVVTSARSATGKPLVEIPPRRIDTIYLSLDKGSKIGPSFRVVGARSPLAPLATSDESPSFNEILTTVTIFNFEITPDYSRTGESDPPILSDITGSAYRKLSLSGIPLPDNPPQTTPESDAEREQVYVDAFDSTLNYRISDIYEGCHASTMPLDVTRVATETTWTPTTDAPLSSKITLPFGPAWSTGISSYVAINVNDDTTQTVEVHDDQGRTQQFLIGANEFVAVPFSSTDAKDYMNTLEIKGEKLVYKKKFGTKLTFSRESLYHQVETSKVFVGATYHVDVIPSTGVFQTSLVPGLPLAAWDSLNSGLVASVGNYQVQYGSNGQLVLANGPTRYLVNNIAPSNYRLTKPTTRLSRASMVRDPLRIRNHLPFPRHKLGTGIQSSEVLRYPVQLQSEISRSGPPVVSQPLEYDFIAGFHDSHYRVGGLAASFQSFKSAGKMQLAFRHGIVNALTGISRNRLVVRSGILDPGAWKDGFLAGASMLGGSIASNLPSLSSINLPSSHGFVATGKETALVLAEKGEIAFSSFSSPLFEEAMFLGSFLAHQSESSRVNQSDFTPNGRNGHQARYYAPELEEFDPANTSQEFDQYALNEFDESVEIATYHGWGEGATWDPNPPVLDGLLSNSVLKRRSHFHRLETVEDKWGNKLSYFYAEGNESLIPDEITDGKRGQKLEITHNGKTISMITGPNDRKTKYTYLDVAINLLPISLLHKVEFPDGSFVKYGYDHDVSTKLDTGNSSHHINLGSIANPRGELWTIEYEQREQSDFPATRFEDGGLPRKVISATHPNGSVAEFESSYSVDRISDNLIVAKSATTVTDVDGTMRTYVYGGANFTSIPKGQIDHTAVDVTSTENYLLFNQLQIVSGPGLVETFEFDPQAGMALKSATDLAGNTTRYEYSETSPLYDDDDTDGTIHRNSFKVAAPIDLFKYYNDPTAKINALGERTEYTYDAETRVMNEVRIFNGVSDADPITPPPQLVQRTTYDIATGNNQKGLRTSEKVYDYRTNTSGALVSETLFGYADTTFPAFMTSKTVKRHAGDPDWAVDLTTTYEPDTKGRVKKEIAANGATTEYTYDEAGNKTQVEDARGVKTKFDYDARGRLTDTTFALGTPAEAKSSTVYDRAGRAIVTVNEANVATFFTYDAMGRVASSTVDLNGNGVPDGRDTDIVTTTTYNAYGQPLTVTDPRGFVTVNEYDGLGRLCRTVAAAGTARAAETEYFYEQPNPEEPDASAYWGGSIFDTSTFKPNRVIDPRGYQTLNVYDKLGRVVETSRMYDVHVVPGEGDGEDTVDEKWATTSTTYDRFGNVATVTDPLGHVTTTVYDTQGRLEKTIFPDETPADLADNPTATAEYTSTGLNWRVTDEMGRQTETEYDALGRPVKVKAPPVVLADRSQVRPEVETQYDLTGNPTHVWDPLDRLTVTEYDVRNRPWKVTAPEVYDALSGAMAHPVTTTYYDLAGRVVRVVGPTGATTDTRYDHAGRVTEVHGAPVPTFTDAVPGAASVLTAVSPVTYTTYDQGGNILTVTDPEGRVTTNTFDELGRMTTTTDHSAFVTAFGYDLAGNRTSVTDALGNITTFTFDGLNRLLKEQPPGAAVATQHVYNALVEEKTLKADGWTLDYAYDARSRLKTTTASRDGLAAADRPVTTRDYDLVGNLLSVTESGARSFLSVSYAYDNHNRILEERHGTNAESPLTSSYTYDLAGNRDTVIYPGGSGVFTAYDALNRATSVAQMTLTAGNTWQPQRTSTWEYDLAGKVLHHNQGLNSRVSSQWDAQGRLFSRVIQGKYLGNVQVEGRSVPEYAVLGIQRYIYDKTGNLRWMSERYTGQSAARTVTLAYDASLRLDTETIAEADGGSQLSDYNYDAVGNRTTYTKTVNGGTPTVSTYTHNAWNQLEQFTRTGSDAATVSYEYDDGGNRKKRTKDGQVDNYTWDHLGRLKSVAHAATSKTYGYEYDYRSRRVSRLEGGELTLCGYSGGTSVVELKRPGTTTATLPGTTEDTFKLSKTFIRGSDMGGGVGGLIYSLKQTASGSSQPQVTLGTGANGAVMGTWASLTNSHVVAPRYNHYNGRGDVAAQVDDAGALSWTGSYEAYGTRTKETGTNDDRQRANTKEEDPTGLLNEGMRYRDLDTGTWLSRDPAGFVDGPNLYAYVRQNPWSKFDPLGLETKDQLDKDIKKETENRDELIQDGKDADEDQADRDETERGVNEHNQNIDELENRKEDIDDVTNHHNSSVDELKALGIKSAKEEWNQKWDPDKVDDSTPDFKKAMEARDGDRFWGKVMTGGLAVIGGTLGGPKGVPSEGPFVYRGLKKGEDPTKGLNARSPGAGNSELQHVAGKRDSQWISTSKDPATASQKYNQDGAGVVKIDLGKVKSDVSDISGGIPKGGRFSNYAKKDQEVLIKDHVPPEAIEQIK
ncbi:MAG: RHS repeat protein [Verrucomicrobiaceae bacterium]|nr:RHS repeat protein [Verrucomicrobiaceae bacterium]